MDEIKNISVLISQIQKATVKKFYDKENPRVEIELFKLK
jgi:hypothetical protein